MLNQIETIQGVFIKELKNRFLCEVLVGEQVVECYVPSSSRMENFLTLSNKRVLLTKNKEGGRTQLSIFAVKMNRNYIILNLNKLNSILKLLIESNRIKAYKGFSACIEKTVGNYKADLLLQSDNEEIIIEVKGVISEAKTAFFPQVFTARGVRQLIQLKQLLLQGKKVHYLFASTSSLINEIKIYTGDKDYTVALNECLDLGMMLSAIKILYDGESIKCSTKIHVSR